MNKNEYIKVNSPEPLKNEVNKIRKIYWLFGIIAVFGIIIGLDIMLGIGILGWMVTFLVVSCIADVKSKTLRELKFSIAQASDNEQLFMKMQSVFISKYNWQVEKSEDGKLVVITKKYIYDIDIKEENGNKYFNIWWRMSLGKALVSRFAFNLRYPIYSNVIAAMGIIAYEIQQMFPEIN